MADEIILEGKTYVPSKQAAQLTGYAQDYIGQLSRKGLIDAKRVAGLWYVEMGSLNGYRTTSEARVREAPQGDTDRGPEALIFFDGAEFISTSKAAELTGYNPDYVGQLARSGAILSKQVGNRWYVERQKILNHKSEKDSLLAAVQTESVGIAHPSEGADSSSINAYKMRNIPITKYTRDDRDLFPPVRRSEISDIEPISSTSRESETVQIRPPVLRLEPIEDNQTIVRSSPIRQKPVKTKSDRNYYWPKLVGLGVVIVVLSIGYALFSGLGQHIGRTDNSTAASNGPMQRVGDWIERVVSPEISYFRTQ